MTEEMKKDDKADQTANPKINQVNSELIISPLVEKAVPNKMGFLEFLTKLSPGKKLRTALDDILHARTGALIAVNCPHLSSICEGGFKVNCKFTPQRLVELAKMDGAIIVSSNLKKILFTNALLVPDTRIPSDETGTRHKAAERTSRQFNTPVIAVSERRGKITLFYDNKSYVLQNSETLLRRAIENLNILEKQREICNDLILNLNILEITNLVSVGDVCAILQRMEIISRVMNTLKRYVIELGKEGGIMQMRMRELSKGIAELKTLILRDYTNQLEGAKNLLSKINFDGLLDTEILSRIIFEESQDKQISPKGYRMLNKLNLTEREINEMVSLFKNLGNIMNATEQELQQVLMHKAGSFKKELENLKEQIIMGKKI